MGIILQLMLKMLNYHKIPLVIEDLEKHYSKSVLFNVKKGKVYSYWVNYTSNLAPMRY